MKKFMYVTLLAASMMFVASCNSGSAGKKNDQTQVTSDSNYYYTCTMHPQIHESKPGNCPICGMTLVKKEVSSSDSTQMNPAADTMKMK